MSLSAKTLKTLWGRAGGRCSYPDCRAVLSVDEDETALPTLIGENCHIVAERDRGPRADRNMPLDQRNSYRNLILLCRNHHRVIDDLVNGEREYSIARLHRMRDCHEGWVREQLGMDEVKQTDEEYYAEIVDVWEKKCHVDEWQNWSGYILSAAGPQMVNDVDRDIDSSRPWLLSRIWPNRYPSLESAFQNFRLVLDDFHNTFLSHARDFGDRLMTRKFYQIDEWNPERYNLLLDRYMYHVGLVCDLMLELTRAANLVCDEVRKNLMPEYRRAEGRLMVESGPHLDLAIRETVVLYSADEARNSQPYPGLDAFRKDRVKRSLHYGND